MKIVLDYGKNGLAVEVPNKNLVQVLKMQPSVALENPMQAVHAALEHPIAMPPLGLLAKTKTTACIVICDITRPVPNKILLPPILATLEANGIRRENITILIATGIHRPNLGAELISLVGADIAANYKIVNHYSKQSETHTFLGKTTHGTEVFIDSTFVQADLKITTGLIEPHLMAGFSGGRKLICPGIASLDTVKVMHSPKILEHPEAREGVITGNPFHEEALEIARMAGVDFIVNVALNEQRQVTGVFAGHQEQAHSEGARFVWQHVRDTVPEPVDMVITTSAGFPLDATFYQAIKGLTAALPIVKPGGAIILAAECQEGLGGPEFSQLVRETADINLFMKNIWREDYFVVDQWQFEELARVLRTAEVFLYSEGIAPADRARMQITFIDSIEAGIATLLKKYGADAKIAVIPKGPYILAELYPLSNRR